jgi:hypothetical protein
MSRILLFAALGALVATGCGGRKQAAPEAGAAAGGAARGTFAAVGPEDRPLAAGVAVYAPGQHDEPLWEGLTGERYELTPGEYDVRVEYFGQEYWRRGVKLGGGEETFKLPMGTLAVEARSSRGDRLEGDVTIFPAGRAEGPPVMEGATFESLAVLAGTYDARVTVQGRERWLRDLSVEAGDVETRTLLEPVGYLRADIVDQNGGPLDAEVWVYGPASPRAPVAAGTGGQRLALLPGRYDVAVRWAGTRDYSAGVAVLVNQTTVERFTFWRSEAP